MSVVNRTTEIISTLKEDVVEYIANPIRLTNRFAAARRDVEPLRQCLLQGDNSLGSSVCLSERPCTASIATTIGI